MLIYQFAMAIGIKKQVVPPSERHFLNKPLLPSLTTCPTKR